MTSGRLIPSVSIPSDLAETPHNPFFKAHVIRYEFIPPGSPLLCSDYQEVRGVIFFARMVQKIRLKAEGRLPVGYHVGMAEPACFDARFCRFWDVDYDHIVALTLAGLTDEQVFDALFAGRRLNPEHILFWNGFLSKRGWRDEVSAELEELKRASGFGDRTDIQTFMDFHDADEGRRSKYAERTA